MGTRYNPLEGWPVSGLAMKGKTTSVVPSGEWVVEPKMDGHHVLVHVGEHGSRLYSTRGGDKTANVPHICKAAASAVPAGSWLDGEVCANSGSTEGWGTTQSVLGSSTNLPHPYHEECQMVVFDVLAWGGDDIRHLPLRDRHEFLRSVRQTSEVLVQTVVMSGTQESVDEILGLGFEGAMVKDLDAPYRSGKRSSAWLKVKPQLTGDAVVIGYKPGQAAFEGMVGAIIFGQYKSGQLFDVGRCSGMDMETRRDITAHQDEYLGRVFEFAYNGRMPTGGFRHPQWKRWREDKAAKDCIDA